MNTERNPANAADLIKSHLQSPEHSWSIAIPGAIAEFMYDAEEEDIEIASGEDRVIASTPRGTLSINLPAEVTCIAFEEFSPCIKSWSQQIVFCLPDELATLSSHQELTELGADTLTEKEHVEGEVLFDLGLGSKYLRFCVRTGDGELLGELRDACGRSVFEAENTIMSVIMEKSPVRIISSALASIEIHGKIPGPEEMSPSGPHTHLLPKFLNSGKPSTPLPNNLTALLTLYPAHPLFDKYGEPRMFDKKRHEHFQTLLTEYGLPEYCSEKSRLNGDGTGEGSEQRPENSHWQRTAKKVRRLQQDYV